MKYLIRQEVDRFRVYKLKKGARQMVSISDRAYPTDDYLFYRDPQCSDAFMMVDIDDCQPYRHAPIYYPTRNLSILLLSSKAADNRKKRFLQLDGSKIEKYLAAVVVVGALLYWGIGQVF